MKATLNPQRELPIIAFTSSGVEVDGDLFFPAVLFTDTWEPTQIDASPTNWPNHPLCLNCLQIITWPNAIPTPQLLDMYWAKNIPVEILPLDMALQHARILEKTAYQLSVFNLG